jgi:pantothenate kinase
MIRPHEVQTFAELIDRARALLGAPGRSILGITGAPGAGKSTVAEAISSVLAGAAVVVPMDGFHLANEELLRLGRRDRKGAPDTFDASGYVALLRRLRDERSGVVYAPRFDRSIETAVAGAIPVAPEVPLVITEGNYLLLPSDAWADVRPLLAEVWFVAPDEAVRVERLVQRHIDHGKAPDEARAWVLGTDARNSDLVIRTRDRADVVVTGDAAQAVVSS